MARSLYVVSSAGDQRLSGSASNVALQGQHKKRIIYIDSMLDNIPLSMEAFRVYAHLARRSSNDSRTAWPSYKSIGYHCFRGSYPNAPSTTLRRKAIEAVKELLDWNMIAVRKGSESNHQTNDYYLTDVGEWRESVSVPSHSNARKSRAKKKDFDEERKYQSGDGGALDPSMRECFLSDGGALDLVMGAHRPSDTGTPKVNPMKPNPIEGNPQNEANFFSDFSCQQNKSVFLKEDNQEEVVSDLTTPSQIDQKPSPKPKPQKLDNFPSNSPNKENLPKPLFSNQSLQQARRYRANQSMDFPDKLGLEKKELERFELELYQWAIIHKPGVAPDWLVRDSTRAVALEDRVNVWLLHFKAYGTLKNFLEKPPGEWEEVYEENGWAKVRTNQSFYQWLYESQIHDRQGVTSQQATEKVHWQLRDRKLASSLWQSYKNYLSNRDREYQEQRKLGASGLGAVPSCLKPKNEISLEQTMEIENRLSGAASSTPQIEGTSDSAPQLSASKEEFTEEERRANLKRLNQMMNEAFRKKDCLPKPQEWEPTYSLEQMNSTLKSGVHSAREQVIKFVEASGDYELLYDNRGFAIAVREVDF